MPKALTLRLLIRSAKRWRFFSIRANRQERFSLVGAQIMGLTPTGRATVELLKLNEQNRLLDRQELRAAGFYPPALIQEK